MGPVTRRQFLASSAKLGLSVATFSALDTLAFAPARGSAASLSLPDIQYDYGAFMAPVIELNGVDFHFAPVYLMAATFTLDRTPTLADQAQLDGALTEIEDTYAFSPSGVFATIAYGLPYFERLNQTNVGLLMPKLLSDESRWALEEAVPSPTDVSPANPGIVKQTFQVPVKIEGNDLVLQLRSDSMDVIADALTGFEQRMAGLITSTSRRLMFTQRGLPRQIADSHDLSYAARVNPESPMWMGFADQQVTAAGPAPITTFAGNASASLTTAVPGTYFDNGCILHMSHVIEDLAQFYAAGSTDPNDNEPFTERCQYAFRGNPIPSQGNADQYTDGGGGAFFANVFMGTGNALAGAQGIDSFNGEHRVGHMAALQQSSRAPDGTAMHIRADGPGFDRMDVPGGSSQPKLQFAIYVPTSEFFARMRANQAALAMVEDNGVDPDDNGLERFITATRRQNYLVPPRRHRAFPIIEWSP